MVFRTTINIIIFNKALRAAYCEIFECFPFSFILLNLNKKFNQSVLPGELELLSVIKRDKRI